MSQSLLDRPPTLAGPWASPPGVVQFNFGHRFARGPAPERKITSFPTLLVGVGMPATVTAGVVYASNSTLVARYPNEWEFFGRIAPVRQSSGAAVDAGIQLVYNLAVEGPGAELSLARRMGPVRLVAVSRLLSEDVSGSGARGARGAIGGGAAIRVGRHVALAGDVVTLLDRSAAAGERVGWSAGLHVAIPGSPHTLSLQAANTNATTLFAGSRGTARTRYGFEFTIPLTLARYFGSRAPGSGDRSPAVDTALGAGPVVAVAARSLAFTPATLEVTAGTTVEWTNDDPLSHTVTAAGGGFDSGLIEPGRKWRRTFTVPGTYRYMCTPHPFMRGTIVVKPQ
jgi:plastocyanin